MKTQTKDPRGRRTARATGILLAASALLAGCAGGDGESDGRVPDEPAPLTVVGACAELVGPRATLLDDALAAGDAVTENGGAQADVDRAVTVRTSLSDLVSDGPEELQDPVGVIVDYLADPAAFDTPQGLSDTLTGAVTEIDTTCAL